MPITSRKIYRPRPQTSAPPPSWLTAPFDKLSTSYRRSLKTHPFLVFGLPFLSVIVAGSFFLTPATALRYEKHDRKTRQVTQEEAMGLGLGRDGVKRERTAGRFEAFQGGDGTGVGKTREARRVGTEKEEYYRLMAKDLDDWEQTRVKRFKGEPDGKFD
jgi:cytochrome c oxidase assembly protein subunit 16